MIAFKDLNDILRLSIAWENKLKDFYDVAEFALQVEKSKKVIQVLRDKLLSKLDILENIEMDKFGKTEWVRYAADLKDEELIPKGKITREAAPAEIFSHILDFEQKLKAFYAQIAAKIVTRSQKELFESLAVFKEEQIEEIKNYMATVSG